MLVNTKLNKSSNNIEIYANHVLVGDEGGEYISSPTDKTIPNNTLLLIVLYDEAAIDTNNLVNICYFTGDSINVSFSAHVKPSQSYCTYTLNITSNTIGLNQYSSDWRPIYCKICKIDEKYL